MSLAIVTSLETPGFESLTPEEGGWVPLEGDAQAALRTLRQTDNIWSGIATLQPCRFSYTAEYAGAIQILEGHAAVTHEGVQHDLTVGSVVYLEPGVATIWEVKTPMKEFFVAALRP